MKIVYGLTPSTETTVYDFWALARDFSVEDDETDRFLEKMQRGVVQEDVDALNILQSRVDERREISEVSVKIDRGGLAARRVLAGLRDEANTKHE
jgi:vanillate O-demethylase monooxygenase subunit